MRRSDLFTDSQTNGAVESDVSIEPKGSIKEILIRVPVSNGQLEVYQVLYISEIEHSGFLIRTNRSAGEFAGVLGALGMRINNTKEIHQGGLRGHIEAVIS